MESDEGNGHRSDAGRIRGDTRGEGKRKGTFIRVKNRERGEREGRDVGPRSELIFSFTRRTCDAAVERCAYTRV